MEHVEYTVEDIDSLFEAKMSNVERVKQHYGGETNKLPREAAQVLAAINKGGYKWDFDSIVQQIDSALEDDQLMSTVKTGKQLAHAILDTYKKLHSLADKSIESSRAGKKNYVPVHELSKEHVKAYFDAFIKGAEIVEKRIAGIKNYYEKLDNESSQIYLKQFHSKLLSDLMWLQKEYSAPSKQDKFPNLLSKLKNIIATLNSISSEKEILWGGTDSLDDTKIKNRVDFIKFVDNFIRDFDVIKNKNFNDRKIGAQRAQRTLKQKTEEVQKMIDYEYILGEIKEAIRGVTGNVGEFGEFAKWNPHLIGTMPNPLHIKEVNDVAEKLLDSDPKIGKILAKQGIKDPIGELASLIIMVAGPRKGRKFFKGIPSLTRPENVAFNNYPEKKYNQTDADTERLKALSNISKTSGKLDKQGNLV